MVYKANINSLFTAQNSLFKIVYLYKYLQDIKLVLNPLNTGTQGINYIKRYGYPQG